MIKYKFSFILFITILLNNTSLFAQFPPNQAEWIVYHTIPIQGILDGYRVYRDIMNGDTAVYMGKTYKKIYTQKLCKCDCSAPNYIPDNAQTLEFLGGIREEDGKVYFSRLNPQIGSQERLLLDFTLQDGDTITYNNYELYVEIDQSNIILKDTEIHKIRYIWSSVYGNWHGISALFYPIYCSNMCYAPDLSTCSVPCAISTATTGQEQDLGIKIYRGASPGTFSFDLPEGMNQLHCSVFSIDGRQLCLEKTFVSGEEISFLGLSTGILVFRVRTDQGQIMAKRVFND